MNLKGVIFDMDGTVVDVTYDWEQIRTELNTQGKPILYYLRGLEEPERSEKWKVLEKYEREATERARIKPGMRGFLDLLNKEGIKKALVTNNSQKNVSFLLEKFNLEFDCVIARESGLWKPSGAPFQAVLKKLGLKKEECCVVGDSHFDVKAAEEAGILNVFILSENKEKFASMPAEVLGSVEELIERIEQLLEKGE
jgi:HAD superfamily hydrolase (TIGR01549 family)